MKTLSFILLALPFAITAKGQETKPVPKIEIFSLQRSFPWKGVPINSGYKSNLNPHLASLGRRNWKKTTNWSTITTTNHLSPKIVDQNGTPATVISHGDLHSVVVNSDGTHSIAVNHGAHTIIVNPDGTHTVVVNP